MNESVVSALKRGKTRGVRKEPLAWVKLLRFALDHPDTQIATEEAADVLGVCEDHVRRLVREGKLKAVRRRNRHVLRLFDVVDARLGVLAEKPAGRAENGGVFARKDGVL